MNLNIVCGSSNCDNYFTATEANKDAILRAAQADDFYLHEDEFYCDSCYEDDIKPDIDFEELWRKEKSQRENLEKLNREIFQNLSSEQEKVRKLASELNDAQEQLRRYESLEEMKEKKFNTDEVMPVIPMPPKSKLPFWNGGK